MSPSASIWTKALPAAHAHDFKSRTITIKVGQEPECFYVNEAMLRKTSKFFEKALKEQWKEGNEREVRLPEMKPHTFNIYLNWALTGKLFLEDGEEVWMSDNQIFDNIADSFVSGDMVFDSEFKDAVTDAAASLFASVRSGQGRWLLGSELRQYLYDNTSSSCATLRRMLVRQLSMSSKLAELVSEDEPPASLYELSVELAKGKSKAMEEFKKEVEDCEYHEHAPGADNCYRTRLH
ncbi:uncharacterized protein RHO25_006602 [Cercospora beticola]|nr:hypothetical protein RHO25_006602 [Cercospora beticola]